MSIQRSAVKEIRLATWHRWRIPAFFLIFFFVSLAILPYLYPRLTSAQEVTEVSSATTNGLYTIGDDIIITITFTESVFTTGKPLLELETGTTDRDALYDGPMGSDTLIFRYTVQAGDTSSDLDYKATNSLKLNGGTIKNAGGDDVTLTLAAPGETGSLGANKDLVVDTTAPVVKNVTSNNANGIYSTDEIINITIAFSEAITVDTSKGTPILELETGNTDRNASYVSGSDSDTLTFRYTVQEGDSSSDLDYKAANSLKLNGGTIKDAAGNNAELTLVAPGEPGSLGDNKELVINTNTRVTNVTSTKGNGTYDTGEVIDITVTFSEEVGVDTDIGTPYLKLETGATDRNAFYVSGKGSDTLTFRYTVQAGDTSPDLDYQAADSLKLNGGTIRDAGGDDAELTLATPGEPGSLGYNKALVIDTDATVTNVNSANADGTYVTNDIIYIAIAFTEEVVVTGTPYLELETGTADRNASYFSGSNSDTLTFKYKVQKGDSSLDLDYRATDSLKLNGGTIEDNTGNDASLTLPAPGEPGSLSANKTLVIDATDPAVTGVTSANMDGTYKEDQVIDVIITFTEEVVVTGTPYLELETGNTDRNASYVSGSGSDTLTFRYTVQEGDSSLDLDYRAADSLKLNDGTIRNVTGDDASLTLPAPGETGSLSANKTLVIGTDTSTNYEVMFPGIDIESIYTASFSNQVPADIDAVDRTDTKVSFRDTGAVTGEIMIAKYKEEPTSPSIPFSDPESAGGTEMEGIKFVDVYVSGFNEGTATITIYYSDNEISGFKENTLSLFYWDGSAWKQAGNISRHTDTNVIMGEVPVSALGGTPIGLGGVEDEDEGEDQGQYLTLFIVLGAIGGIAVIVVLTWLFWDDRRKKQKAHWTSVKTPKNIGLPGR